MMNRTFSTMMTSAVVLGSLMVGCSAQDHPKLASDAPASATKVERLLADKDYGGALAAAEQQVAADPRNGGVRALLGRAYLANGRYVSARTAFSDALTLGSSDPRTIVSLALCEAGLGDLRAARKLLSDHIADLPAADYGLAMAMTGDAREGVRALLEAANAPDATAKTRQNLAYALALGGAWGQARLIAGQDLSARDAEARIGEWTQLVARGSESDRVVAMLGVAPRTDDAGLPSQLALNATPEAPALASAADIGPVPAKADAPEAVTAPAAQPARVADAAPATTPVTVAVARSEDKPAFTPAALAAVLAKPPMVSVTPVEPLESADARGSVPDAAPSFAPAVKRDSPSAAAVKAAFATSQFPVAISKPGTAPIDATLKSAFASPAGSSGPQRKARFVNTLGAPLAEGRASDWVVQLGAYDSDALAKQQWTKLSATRTAIKPFTAVHSTVAVGGRTYYRLAIRGFQDRGAALSACSTLRNGGQPCFVRLDDKGAKSKG